MEIDNILLERFFRNQCTEQEALEVSKYLEAHPHRLDEVFPHQLWEDMDEGSEMTADKKDVLLQKILTTLQIKRRPTTLMRMLPFAAAVLIIMGIGWWLGTGTETPDRMETQTVTAYTLVKINYGKEDMKLDIADGSIIYLKPGGEIRYLEQLGKQSRDFKLKGVARFKVASDKIRPFNVYAGGTVTTALGTDFTISSQEDGNRVSVLLHSGKVVVQSDSSANGKGMEKTYLLPGNKLLINKANFALALIKDAGRQMPSPKISMPNGQTELSATEISFRNQSLNEIFNVLERDFSAVIEFDKNQLAGMYFTGSFKRNAHTVALVLNEIALLNHLTIEKRDSTYILKPQSNH
jgi:transmembrane sensor